MDLGLSRHAREGYTVTRRCPFARDGLDHLVNGEYAWERQWVWGFGMGLTLGFDENSVQIIQQFTLGHECVHFCLCFANTVYFFSPRPERP